MIRGVDLEIVEQSRREYSGGVQIIRPNNVRLNGLDVAVPSGERITIQASDTELVVATAPLLVRTLAIHPEEPPPVDDSDPPIFAKLVDDLGGHDPFIVADLIGAHGNALKSEITRAGRITYASFADVVEGLER